MVNYYELLGITSTATPQEIEKAYYKKVMLFHPDLNANNKLSEDFTKQLNEAYEVLSDKVRRKTYDQLLVNKLMQSWLRQLISKRIIQPFHTALGKYHRLTSPAVYIIHDDMITTLKKAYNPGLEKGGLFLFRHHEQDGKLSMVLEKVIFLPNTSLNPEIQYSCETTPLNKAITKALQNELLPCFFHSHPTKHENVIMESFEYYRQMNTSSDDKMASQFCLFPNDLNLRLPEFLVIANGRLSTGVFIGIYGGMVAPLDFETRKNELTESFTNNVSDHVTRLFNDPKGKWFGIAGAAILTYLAFKYPKYIIQTIATTAAVIPGVIYETPLIHKFFGISHGGTSLEIQLPQIPDTQIHADEWKINFIKQGNRNT